MASRKEQKEQARAQREAAERAAAQGDQRKRRLTILGGVLAAAVVVVVIAIVISSGGGSKDAPTGLATGTTADQTAADVSTLLDGIPQSGSRLGKATAPVSMQYYGDLECPVCRTFTLGALPQVISNYVRPGKLKITYKSLQTATPDSTTFQTQQVAALAAGKQNLMWPFIELFYHQQGEEGTSYVTEDYLKSLAAQVKGLKLPQWMSDRGQAALKQEIATDAGDAVKVGATGTPTLIITGPKGTTALAAAPAYADLAAAIDKVS
jgi:protein-disulfide isomerase